MKTLLYFSVLVITLCCAPRYDSVRKIAKENRTSLPGVVWLMDSVFIDITEIRNLDYLEYVHWLKKYQPVLYASALPDSTVWRDGSSYNEPYVHFYFTHPAYHNYPLVGVSYQQAQDFCKWRTERVKEFLALNKNNALSKQGIKDFYYRLPTKQEWEFAAYAGLNETYPYGMEKIISKKNMLQVNVKDTTLQAFQDVTCPVNSYHSNKFGIYNMIGNVMEMIAIKGVSKGGSWRNELNECAISNSLSYTKPDASLGFRCVCVVRR